MFRSHLKIAWRNFLRYKAYSSVNVFGLALGLACCLMILLYVQDELSFDTFPAAIFRKRTPPRRNKLSSSMKPRSENSAGIRRSARK